MSNTPTQLPYRTNYAELYPVHAECPHCWYNLIRYRMHNEMDQARFLPECPCCGNELYGF